MSNTSRKDFESWKIEKANRILEVTQLIAEKMISEGCTDSGPTRATALLIALDRSDNTGWDAWQAAIKTQETIQSNSFLRERAQLEQEWCELRKLKQSQQEWNELQKRPQVAIKTQETITTELLSALKRLVVCHGSDGIEYSGAHPMAEARAAIAKAEANT